MRKAVVFLACFMVVFLYGGVLFADDSFTATLDRSEISKEETATLIFSLKTEKKNEEVSLPVIPRVPGLFIFYRQTRQVLSPQGGKVSPATEFVYTLSAEAVGEKVIPPVGIHVGEKLLVAEPLTLNVVSPVSGSSKSKMSYGLAENSDGALDSGQSPKAFARVFVDNPRPFIYEPVKITLWAYATTPFQYQGFKGEPTSKTFTRIKEFTGKFLPQENTEVVEGETYFGRSLEEEIWFPNQSGPLTLELGEITLSLKTKGKNLFDRSFQEERPAGHFGSHAEPMVLKVEPISFEVRPLPEEDKPPDFSGAVGDFTVAASIDKTGLQVGDSATLKFQIRGRGNLKQMKDPAFGKFPFATSFEPRGTEKVEQGKTSFEVEKNYEVILITNQEGNFTVDPISFSYFNPKFHKYRRVVTTMIPITVQEKSKSTLAAPVQPPKTEPEVVGQDVYYLKKEPGPLRSGTTSFLRSPLFWGIQCIPLIVLFLALSWQSYQRYLIRNEAVLRRRRALQASSVHLKKAEHHLSQGRIPDFAKEATEALLGYLSDKTGLPKGGLTLDRIDSLIQNGGGDENVRRSVRECLELLQALQFSATPRMDKDPKTSFELSKAVLRQLEKVTL